MNKIDNEGPFINLLETQLDFWFEYTYLKDMAHKEYMLAKYAKNIDKKVK